VAHQGSNLSPTALLVGRLLAVVVLAATVSASPARAQSSGGDSAILVLAASSLADVLHPIADAWTDATGISVRFSFDATSRLAPQAVSGAPADVFIAADESWMRWLADRGATDFASARPVAGNSLVAVVPAGTSSAGGLQLLTAATRVGLAGENVPAGRYAREALVSTGIWSRIESRVVTGGSVRGVLEWVARGEVDAGVVYGTDARAESAVRVVHTFEPGSHIPIRYWAAPLFESRSGEAAAGFVDYLGSPATVDGFRQSGFTVPADGFDLPLSPVADGPVPAAPTPSQTVAASSGPPATLPSVGSAIRLSLFVALLATLAGLLPAMGLGWLLARHDFRGKVVVSTVVLAPLVIPPVVTGFLLLSVLGTQSFLGGALASLGLRVPFTVLGAAVAAFIVGLPLYVLSIRGAFEAIDPQYEELSWTLGHPPKRTFVRISLPLALPGIAAGAILAFARALGEFGATVVLAGNVEGSTRTIALAVYTLLESPSGRETMWVLVVASVGLSLLALLGYEALSRRQRTRLSDGHVR